MSTETMNRRVVAALLAAAIASAAGVPAGDYLLGRVDANITAENKVVVAEMRITGARGSRTVRTRSWVSGTDKAFTEYLAPERDRGTRMLKLGNQLWVYSPQSDRTLLLSGHMLRQSIAGSDLSYEDMMEDPRLASSYDATTVGADSVAGRPAWKLRLQARAGDVAYAARNLWVDQERFVVLREERFSRSGRLLKTTEVTEMRRFDGRWVAARAVFRDALKSGGGTELVVDSLRFNVEIPASRFSKAALR